MKNEGKFWSCALRLGRQTLIVASTSVWLWLTALFAAVSVHATTYYVSTNGNDSWNGLSSNYVSGATGPFADFNHVNWGGPNALVAGDVVYVKGGTYNSPNQTSYGSFISLNGQSGTRANPIVISNYPGQVPLIYASPQTNNSCAISMKNCNWIKVFGVNETNNFYGVNLQGLTNCEFANLDCGGGPANMGFAVSVFLLDANSVSNWVHNCTVHDCVVDPPSRDEGHAFSFGQFYGTYNGLPDYSGYNIIESNTVYHSCHDAMSIYCGNNVVRHNFIHNENFIFRLDLQTNGSARCVEVGGVYGGQGNVFENNRIQWAGLSYTAGDHGIEIDGPGSSIYRNNTFADCPASGLTIYGGKVGGAQLYWGSNYIYNNTIALNGLTLASSFAIYANNGSGVWDPSSTNSVASVWKPSITIANSTNNFFVNNLFSGNYLDGTYGEDVPYATGVSDYRANLTRSMATAGYVDTNDGGAWSQTQPNFALAYNSPAIDAGAWLATITSASGSGNSFNVNNAGWFFAGLTAAGHAVPGDTIQLQGQAATATISAVSGNTISVNSTLTWTKGQGVALVYSGKAPDAGAFEYQAISSFTNNDLTPPEDLRIEAANP